MVFQFKEYTTMNKKTYIIPTLLIVNVDASQMIAESIGVNPDQQVNSNFTKDEGDWDEVWDD